MKNKIVVIGSSNTDMVISMEKLPKPGQTLLGHDFTIHPGGKGANQAVAAARTGGNVHFIAAIGEDHFGKAAINNFKKDGIDTSHIKVCQRHPSGVALIMVDQHGENLIAVASGANFQLTPDDIDPTIFQQDAHCVLMQLETPIETVLHAANLAKANQALVILNPAPAKNIPEALLQIVDIITPNATEAERLTGIKVVDYTTAQDAANVLRDVGVKSVIITLGDKGVFIMDEQSRSRLIPPFQARAVDATGAGDTFNGAFCTALSDGKGLYDAVDYANLAAALSVTRHGAQTAIPTAQDINLSHLKPIAR